MATITFSEQSIAPVQRRTAKANPFAAAMAQLDDGNVRVLKPETGESISTLVQHLRAAARTIGRSVSINWLDAQGGLLRQQKGKSVPDGTVAIRFVLRALVTRTTATAAPVESVKPVTKKAGK